MKIGNFISDHNVPFTQTDKVLSLIKKHFPYIKRIKVVFNDGEPSSEYPNAKCNCLMGIEVSCYYDKIIVGRNVYGDRICTSGIKLKLCDRVDKKGVHQFEMRVAGIGHYIPSGEKDTTQIYLYSSGWYGGYQYNTELDELEWEEIGRYFARFTTMQSLSKSQMQKIIDRFEEDGDYFYEVAYYDD